MNIRTRIYYSLLALLHFFPKAADVFWHLQWYLLFNSMIKTGKDITIVCTTQCTCEMFVGHCNYCETLSHLVPLLPKWILKVAMDCIRRQIHSDHDCDHVSILSNNQIS